MSLPTLPKRMVPNLPQLRRSVYSLLNGGQGPVLASATATATATAPPSSKFVDGGQAVLDRGVAFPPLKVGRALLLVLCSPFTSTDLINNCLNAQFYRAHPLSHPPLPVHQVR